MNYLPRHSIRRKLIFLLTTVATVTVLLSCSGLVVYHWRQLSQALYREGYTQANLVGANSAAALLFGDAKAAAETLSALRLDSRVRQACLYDRSSAVVASLRSGAGCPARVETVSTFNFRTFHIIHPVSVNGEATGSLYLEYSLTELRHMVVQSLKVSAATAFAAMLVALMLASYTQQWISRPLLQLTRVAVRVRKEGRYDVRAHCSSSDEVGVLVDHFNQMLSGIQQRDRELRDSYDLLEQKVQERTADLTIEITERKLIERDLERARVLAEESSQAKSLFLANMSHELRTPLNAIIGYGEMLHEDACAGGNVEIEADLQKILSSARHLRAVISDVLDLSKIEAGQLDIRVEPASCNGLLQDVVATAEVLSRTNRNQLFVEPLPHDAEVMVDPLRLRQALLNLVSNACKFTEDGRITVRAAMLKKNDTQWAVWSVQDTGAGIAEADQSKLFRNFSQVDSSATRKHGGTGLGLAISQEICRAMGGDIVVHSVVDVGSTFSIEMPLARQPMTLAMT